MTAPHPADMVDPLLELHISLDELPKASQWLNTIAAHDGWPERMRFGLELSLEEALTNIISYGFAGAEELPPIRVEFERQPAGKVALHITDKGIAFDPTGVPEPEVPASMHDSKVGGHGLQLMRHFLSDISYQRIGAENRLTLVADPSKGE